MPDVKHCRFFLLRYVPDVVKNEPVNLGLVLLEDGSDGFAGVRFTRDWRHVRCAHPDVDVELLESYETEFQRLLDSRVPEIINYRGPMSRHNWLLQQIQDSLSGSLQLTPTTPVFTESPQAELGKLAHAYLESGIRDSRLPTGRRAIVHAMQTAFDRAGVWQLMWKDIAIAQYTDTGDPHKIDCGYPVNGDLRLYHGLSLATDSDSAIVLGSSYDVLRPALSERQVAASCTLTAILQDDLDINDKNVAYALNTLQQHDIFIAEMRDLPQIADRARIELKA